MVPELDQAFFAAVAFGSIAAGLGATLLAFRAADWFAERAVRLWDRLRFEASPLCLDCAGRGWRRWREGDGAPVKGWVDCKLCRGLGRIVDDAV